MGACKSILRAVGISRAHPTFNQRFTPGAIRHLRQQRWANTSKAREELGYAPTEFRDALRDVYVFHSSRGTIRRRRISSTAIAGDSARSGAIEPERRSG